MYMYIYEQYSVPIQQQKLDANYSSEFIPSSLLWDMVELYHSRALRFYVYPIQ